MEPTTGTVRESLLKRQVVLAQEYLALLLLNIFDLFMTGFIFRNHGAEANGLARWFLENTGPSGFAIYKFAMVAFIVVLCEVIAVKRSIEYAKRLVLFGCIVYFAVVCYESYGIIKYIQVQHVHDSDQGGSAESMLPVLWPWVKATVGCWLKPGWTL